MDPLPSSKRVKSYEYIKYIINTLYTNVTREESKKRRRKLGGGARFIEFHCIDLVEITLPAYKIPATAGGER